MQDSALHPVLPCENSQRTKKQTGVRACGKTREQTAPWRGAAPFWHISSAQTEPSLLCDAFGSFSAASWACGFIHARSRLASFHVCARHVVMVPARARASGPPLAGLDGVDRSQPPMARERRFLCLRNARLQAGEGECRCEDYSYGEPRTMNNAHLH